MPPTALLRITPTHARWMAHVSEGARFSGAGDCLEGPWIEAEVL